MNISFDLLINYVNGFCSSDNGGVTQKNVYITQKVQMLNIKKVQ